jgi:outer membrane protein TolC
MIRTFTNLAGILAFAFILAPSVRADLGWEECLRTTLDKSPRLAQARISIPEQEGYALASRSALLPSLNMTALSLPPVASFNLQQSVLNLPAVAVAKSGRSRVSAAQVNYELELWRLVEELRAAYLQVEYHQKLLSIRLLYAEELNASFLSTRDLVNAGQARAGDLRRLEVNLGLARTSVNQAKMDLDQAWLDLTEMMGLPARDIKETPRVSEVFTPVLPENLDEKEWIVTALAKRPDLRALEALKTTGTWQLEAVKYAGFPVVTAVAETRLAPDTGGLLGNISVSRNDDNETVQSNFFFGANISWKIWDGGERLGKAKEGQAKLEAIDVGIRRLRELTIPGQVRMALNGLRSAEAAYRLVHDPEKDREYQKYAAQLLEAGRITKLEALEVSRDRVNRQQDSLQALYRLELARLGLQAASGQAVEYRNAPAVALP